LGVVEHRAKPGTSLDEMKKSGYVDEAYLKKLAATAGFRFEAASAVNDNPKDTKDYAQGVWTLPPTLRLGEKDRDKYLAIGESDRMTLKFVKVAPKTDSAARATRAVGPARRGGGLLRARSMRQRTERRFGGEHRRLKRWNIIA